jgi:hypothetical protein
MARSRLLIGVAALTLMLAGCSFAEEVVLPSLTGEPPASEKKAAQAAGAEAKAGDQTQYGATRAPVEPVSTGELQGGGYAEEPTGTVVVAAADETPVQQTGTEVGRKAAEQRGELQSLQSAIGGRQQAHAQLNESLRQSSQTYFATVAAITARLRIGTTPGNPVLVSQWNAAQAELDRLSTEVAAMNSLGNQIAGDSATANYLLDAVRATYGLPGAIEEDHRQLKLIEDETSRVVVLIDRLLSEAQQTVSRYTSYINSERRNLTALGNAIKLGEYVGPSLSSLDGDMSLTRGSVEGAKVAAKQLSRRNPLVIIRFERDDLKYRQTLYDAVAAALERRPNSRFDLVAVAPKKGLATQVALETNSSKRQAERVLHSLIEMGLPPNRLSLSSMTSAAVETGEVHVYVR